jgi:hypothetical protein
MNNNTLNGNIRRGTGKPGGFRFLHRFSDSMLHTSLMVALGLLVCGVIFKALTVGVSVWLLDPVVVQGQAQTQTQLQTAPQRSTPANVQ